MIRIAITILSLFLSLLNALAQDFKGIAEYQSKTKLDIQIDSTRIPKERIADFKEMMKSQLEKKYILSFNKSEALYKEEEKLEQPGRGGGMRFMMGGFSQGIYYKNLKEKRYTRQLESFSKEFLIKDSLKTYQWQLEDESKMIGEHLCFKATTTKEIPDIRVGTPPKKEDATNDEQPKTKIITVTAWYTPEIPINNGPSDYWGLPGLILELNEENMIFLCTKIVLNPKESFELKEPEKGKVVTQKEFDKIVTDKMKEMQEMYGGGERKGDGAGGHRIIIRQ
jgi:GLPGLI family protein